MTQKTAVLVRVSDEMKEWLVSRAKTNLRSINTEVLKVLMDAKHADQQTQTN